MKTILAAYSGVLKGTGSSILSALQDLSVAFWPCRSKMEKHLQVISVLQWVLSFLALGAACTVLLVYMFCTDCWLIAAMYTAWLIMDWNTPKQGGRRSSWVRNWTVWTYFRDYFPVRLIKTHNLLPNRNYIFGYHPHGIFCFGAFCNFGTEATGFSKKFPGIKPSLATLAGNFRIPVLRDYLMSGGERKWRALECVLLKPITTIVGEPITVPKIEDPTDEMVDLYHTMYIKSLQCLFDKYKTRSGLKESDVLYIQ
ncbi:Diacylglycerol O-acyltransferase 2 [Dissostichus eleginoides]|uniref:Diacylglycerol O-acyltransferase 2 n=1 Tax=Dissostichus eleginoides TaxID=100907 RepID=A0AAD9BJC2_DISEL|nr:Diacylglycerol O-acyltransferase 2 [Dissostichus eleginoides]